MPSKIIKNIIVKGNISEIFQLWTEVENFPHFMKNIKSVKTIGDNKTHWVMEGHLGKDLEWNAETTAFEQNRRIAWKSTSGDIQTSGQVTFKDLNDVETEVTLMMQYTPPAGGIGQVAAQLFEHPDKRAEEDLKQFKKYAEGRFSSIVR